MAWLTSFLKYAVRLRLAPYVPVPHAVGAEMLKLAKLKPGEVVAECAAETRAFFARQRPPIASPSA